MRLSQTFPFAIAAASWLLVVAGCGYGEVSPVTYQYSKALYSIGNRKADEAVDPVSRQIEQSRTAGDITEREAGWLRDIVSDARKERWTRVCTSCRDIMESQVK